MSRPKLLALLCLTVVCAPALAVEPRPLAIAIHGGAGVIDPAKMTPERAASYRAGLAAALDAAIMDGHGPRAGAVAGVRHVKNPVELARLVMEKSPHVLLVAEGAEEFALEQGMVLVPRDYFRTEARIRELEEARREAGQVKATAPGAGGTVGAVALDGAGHLAAATSTGGITNKHRGRVGDSPIIGAGTYADDGWCAVSSTGQGEFFMRQVVAFDICALVQYRHLTLAQAVRELIHEKLRRTGGEGGVIAVDRSGNIAMDFNSVGMFRGARDSRGRRDIAMHGGAGPVPRAMLSQLREQRYRGGLEAALDGGFALLARGGSSLDAVSA